MTRINSNLSTPLQKRDDYTCAKENADNAEDDSSINSLDINSRSKKSIVILGLSMLNA